MNSLQKETDEDNGLQFEDEEEESDRRKKSKKSRYHSQRHSMEHSTDITSNPDSKNDFHSRYSKLLTFHPIKISINFRYHSYQIICIFTYFPKLGKYLQDFISKFNAILFYINRIGWSHLQNR